jgi:hypothetical protein
MTRCSCGDRTQNAAVVVPFLLKVYQPDVNCLHRELHSTSQEALSLLGRMERRGLQPDRVTFTALLGACGGANSTRTVRTFPFEVTHCGLYFRIGVVYDKNARVCAILYSLQAV